jgi:uncharacterized protein YacL
MNISLAFMRIFFIVLSIFFMTTYMISVPSGSLSLNILIGIGLGAVFGLVLIGFDTWFRRFNLRAFNIAIIGIFIGYLMGQALVLVFDSILEISSISVALLPQMLEIIKLGLFLFGIYLGTIMTLRAADEFYVSIPFVKLTPTVEKKKDLLIDLSVLSDARIIDLAASGLLDHQLVIPRFIVKELYAQAELGDEGSKAKARRALDVLKKLEAIATLALRYNDTDFPDIRDLTTKLVRLARLLDANILSADLNRIQTASIEGVRIINIHALSNALKPLTQGGEMIKIKIQRYGKEPRQGVGYLEDGTMVVVNGGGSYIGETIEAQVLSVKHTTSGRLIFCNALETGEHFSHHHYEDDEYQEDNER